MSHAMKSAFLKDGQPQRPSRRCRAGAARSGHGQPGTGKGAVFQLMPQHFRQNVGLMIGLVGTTGDAGGFYLATSLGHAKQLIGSYSLGFILFAGLALVAWTGIASLHPRWRREKDATAVRI
jgi:NNP family nitrate/nitrite transporter-like MFS transporter